MNHSHTLHGLLIIYKIKEKLSLFRDLDPLQAPNWTVRVRMLDEPQCLLGTYNFYRPQRSWAKVMFLQTSVILSTGGSASVHTGMPHPPGADTTPWEQTLQSRHTHTPWEQTPPQADTPLEQTP